MNHRHLGLVASVLVTLLSPTLPAQDRGDRQTLQHDGRTRSYIVRAPRDVGRDRTPLPVVLVLHGGGGNAQNAERMTGFTDLVERERLIAVYPDGTGRLPTTLLTWNADHCCGSAMTNRVDDVGFIAALLDTLAARYPVDAARIYVTGMSNGGMMAHKLARELPQRIAAIAPVVGAIFEGAPPPKGPVSVLAINGLLDRSVPVHGGLGEGVGRNSWSGTPTQDNLGQGRYWAAAGGCSAEPERAQQGAVITWTHRCPAGRSVQVVQLEDNGHAWPGGQRGLPRADGPSRSYDATARMWEFFKAYPRR
jgi:polyhydroxybutyrate depolymerase